jgi:hypothetical protein
MNSNYGGFFYQGYILVPTNFYFYCQQMFWVVLFLFIVEIKRNEYWFTRGMLKAEGIHFILWVLLIYPPAKGGYRKRHTIINDIHIFKASLSRIW